MIPFWVKALVLGLIVAAVVAACHHRDLGLIAQGEARQRAVDQAEVDKLKRDAVVKLEAALKEKGDVERKLQELADVQAIKDAKHVRTVADLTGRLAALVSSGAGRLRDPNQASGCGSGGGSPAPSATASTSPGADNGAQTGGLLSAQLTGLLQRLTEEADTVNNAYISCRGVLMLSPQ